AAANRRPLRGPLRARPPARPVRGRAHSGAPLRARGADRRARRPSRRCPHPGPPAATRAPTLRALPGQRRRQRGRGRLRKAGLSESIGLEVRRLQDDVELPTRAYDGDAGIDLVAAETHRLEPGERAIIGTGLSVAIPAGYAGLVLPRSGLAARHGLTIVN